MGHLSILTGWLETVAKWFEFKLDFTFSGKSYYQAKVVIRLCHRVVSNIGYYLSQFKTNALDRVLLLKKATLKDSPFK